MADSSTWSLVRDGDSFEREWAAQVLDRFGSYEAFWRGHIVPLSFRPWQPDNQFLRPSLPAHLIGLADAAYAVFYHLAHGHAYERRLLYRKDPTDFPRPTECLYCFFAHAHSAHEALLHLCCAVNDVLARYGRPELFGIVRSATERRHPSRLEACTPAVAGCPSVDIAAYQDMQSALAAYRNLLIHQKPIFLQNRWLPRTRELDRYSGLAAIGLVARDPDCLRRDYRPVDEALAEILGAVKRVCEMVFAAAVAHLDALAETGYARDQRKLGQDRKLTRRKFERIRER